MDTIYLQDLPEVEDFPQPDPSFETYIDRLAAGVSYVRGIDNVDRRDRDLLNGLYILSFEIKKLKEEIECLKKK